MKANIYRKFNKEVYEKALSNLGSTIKEYREDSGFKDLSEFADAINKRAGYYQKIGRIGRITIPYLEMLENGEVDELPPVDLIHLVASTLKQADSRFNSEDRAEIFNSYDRIITEHIRKNRIDLPKSNYAATQRNARKLMANIMREAESIWQDFKELIGDSGFSLKDIKVGKSFVQEKFLIGLGIKESTHREDLEKIRKSMTENGIISDSDKKTTKNNIRYKNIEIAVEKLRYRYYEYCEISGITDMSGKRIR